MDFKVKDAGAAQVSVEAISRENGIELYEINVVYSAEQTPERVTVSFATPNKDIYSIWSPSIRFDRHLGPAWQKRTSNSRLAFMMPLHALVSADGKNRVMLALADTKTPIAIRTGVHEETANTEWEIEFFTHQVAPIKEYKTIIRIDTRNLPFYDSVYDVVSWWENDCGYKPAYVPEHAKLPMNSLWYSYHQNLDVEDIIRECELSKAFGMDTVIIDDGWQTDDSNRGYRFCGDWEVATSKIPDMKEFIKRIHETGMKVILWYGFPFVGKESRAYKLLSDMVLNEIRKDAHWTLDPRYKKVRDHLISVCTKGVREWGLDGVKLDFIDCFVAGSAAAEFDPRRDYRSVEDAVDRLMTDITDELRSINPDVLIEFRQYYIGPAIRKYGNMFRVADCPNDAICNRQDIVDLRLTSGESAVHSDMIMWNKGDDVESAALQFASVLYSVPQVSVKIATLSEEHKKMLRFYLAFWRENRETLIGGKLWAKNPESAYSIVCAEKDEKAVFTAYTDTIIDCRAYEEVIAVNCSCKDELIIKGASGKEYEVLNCKGETLLKGKLEDALAEISVPLSGMIFIK